MVVRINSSMFLLFGMFYRITKNRFTNTLRIQHVFIFVQILFVSLLNVSCTHELYYEGRQELLKTYYFESFVLEAKNNPGLKEDVVFDVSNQTSLFAVLNSEFDASNAIVTFRVRAGNVKIGNVDQKSGKSVVNLSRPQKYTIYYDSYTKKDIFVNLIPYTGLPVVMVNVQDDKQILDRETWMQSCIQVFGVGQFDDFTDSVFIRGRGHASWTEFPKKGYNLKFPQRTKVLGMKKHKRWCLIANWHDRTRLRNDVTFEIGRLSYALDWTPKGNFVELYVNGKHEGMYYLCEAIRVDKNRIDIDELSHDVTDSIQITGGYLYEVDSYGTQDNFFSTPAKRWPVGIHTPDRDECNDIQKQYALNFITELETDLVNRKFTFSHENLDYNSFADYFIIQNFTGNEDFKLVKSQYYYKARCGKLYAGPLWDFDYMTYINAEKPLIWPFVYDCLRYDPVFIDSLRNRWALLSSSIVNHINSYIDSREKYLEKSEVINGKMWPTPLMNGDELYSFHDAVVNMKIYIEKRKAYLDQIFFSLKASK